MMKAKWTNWRGLGRDSRGAEIAEFAMVLPLLFMFLMAIFWFGQAFRTYGTLTQAARQGARAAVAPVCTTCAAGNSAEQNAATAVSNAMAAAHLNTAQLQPLTGWTPPALYLCTPAGTACGSPVPCDAQPTINVCVQENVQLSASCSGGGAPTCGTSVSMRYKYGYHFYIPCYPQPCNSLDLGAMNLPGQAQMRAETHTVAEP
jgi:Flp pilus assembly protein TadG